jgi:hypothetical protein
MTTSRQEEDLEELATIVFNATRSMRWARFPLRRFVAQQVSFKNSSAVRLLGYSAATLYPSVSLRDPLAEVASKTIKFLNYLGANDTDGRGIGDYSREQILVGMRSMVEHYDITGALAQVLSRDTERFPALSCYIAAGVALSELAVADPHFKVVNPGVESFYDCLQSRRVLPSNEEILSRLYDTVARVFTES